MGVLFAGVSSLLSRAMSTTQSVERRNDLIDLRNYLRSFVSCADTFAAQPCNGGALEVLAFSKTSKKVLVARGGSKFGKYSVSASCQMVDGYKTFEFTYLRNKDTGPLFETVPITCP